MPGFWGSELDRIKSFGNFPGTREGGISKLGRGESGDWGRSAGCSTTPRDDQEMIYYI